LDFDKSIEFVTLNSTDPFDIVRLEYILSQKVPGNEELENIILSQRRDGSWSPFWAEGSSSLDATCYRLALLEQAGIRKHRVIDQAIDFITSRMHEDGSFEEELALKDLCPPWAVPGEVGPTIYITANCAFWINYYTSSVDPRTVMFLESQIKDNATIPSFLHTYWLIGGLFHSIGMDEAAKPIFQRLVERCSEMSADNLTWLINTLIASRVDREAEVIRVSASYLARLQQHDGSWRSDDGAWKDVHTTLEAIRALRYIG